MKPIILCLLLAVSASCASEVSSTDSIEEKKPDEKRLLQLKWMLGRWENNSDEGDLSEIWKQENDSTLNGWSYFVIQGDTVFAESVRLIERKGKISYCVTTIGQNDDKEVAFELTELDGKNPTFECPKHDYPSKITYTAKGDSLIAEISGIEKGKKKSEQFRMKKN